VLAHSEGGRWLLAGSRRPPRCRRGTRGRCDNHGHDDGYDFLFLVILVVVDLDDDSDLNLDLVCVVQFDGVSLGNLGHGGIWLFLLGIDGGVGGFLGHSGSYVTDR
jgi:hypothetical protein